MFHSKTHCITQPEIRDQQLSPATTQFLLSAHWYDGTCRNPTITFHKNSDISHKLRPHLEDPRAVSGSSGKLLCQPPKMCPIPVPTPAAVMQDTKTSCHKVKLLLTHSQCLPFILAHIHAFAILQISRLLLQASFSSPSTC